LVLGLSGALFAVAAAGGPLAYPALAQTPSANGGFGPTLCSEVSASAVSAIVGHRVQPATYTGIAALSGYVHGPGTTVGCVYWPPGANMATTTGEVDFGYYLWAKPFSAAELKEFAAAKGVSSCPGLDVTAFCHAGGVRGPGRLPAPSELLAVQGRKELMIDVYKLAVPKLSLLAKLAIPKFF
jgi:hypothetical protein